MGKHGITGKPGRDGKNGKNGKPGGNGKPGTDEKETVLHNYVTNGGYTYYVMKRKFKQ
jgi:hypothetical protein